MGLLIAILVGGISGWLAGRIMNSDFAILGSPILGNIILGMVGGTVGSVLLGLVGIHGSGIIGTIIVSVIGACVLIGVLRKIG